VKLTTHLQLILRLRMSVTIPPFSIRLQRMVLNYDKGKFTLLLSLYSNEWVTVLKSVVDTSLLETSTTNIIMRIRRKKKALPPTN
jgi:hypothetical protein